MARFEYYRVDHPEPHAARARQLLAAHPELRTLFGTTPSTAVWIVALVAAQLALSVLVADRPWWIWLPTAYIVGATIDHALWALIHDTTHNLVFRGRASNFVIAIVANLPLVAPAAIGFSKFHLLHHRHMGDLEFDAGIPGPTEARVIGQSGTKKAAWIGSTAVVQGVVRPMRMKRVKVFDGWIFANIVVQVLAMTALGWWFGGGPFKYLVASTILAIGLHPLGARWIQEHFALVPGQETYSYYGPLNRISFNVGYHFEHHDLITVPWSRLPRIRQMAPEFYNELHSYQSWTTLLVRFLGDREITLFNHVTRPGSSERRSVRQP